MIVRTKGSVRVLVQQKKKRRLGACHPFKVKIMRITLLKENDPNAGRLIEALRHIGYDNYEAIADILDNSIDAGATTIWIRVVQRNSEPEIYIADNGIGMDEETLDQALRLGSETVRDGKSDLGRFGMGLVTASLSIARRLVVITRNDVGTLASSWDVDTILEKNAFVKTFGKASSAKEQIFDEITEGSPHGTVVILKKCDRLSNRSNTTLMAKTLAGHIARVYRHFIRAGRNIFINGELLQALDPMQGDEGEIIMDEFIPIAVAGLTEKVRCKIVLVPEQTSSETEVSRSMRNQGFSILRNHREIVSAVTLQMFTKHNDFNRMRGEIFFPSSLDEFVGIEFTKRQVSLEQSLNDQLRAILVPTCRTIKRREATRHKTADAPVRKGLHDQSKKLIAEKSKLLVRPRRRTKGGVSNQVDQDGRRAALAATLDCEFVEEKLGPNGQIYECDSSGSKVLIRYNVEHPFFQKFVSENVGEGRLVTTTDFLIFSMALAELHFIEDTEADYINTFKALLSSNLRTLLN